MAHVPSSSSVYVSARAGKSKKSAARKVRSMTIDRAQNGFTSDTHYESSAKDRKSDPWEPSERHVHADAAALQEHVARAFGEPKPAAAEPDGGAAQDED